ncbi:MAG: GTP cyclohydrolase II [Rhodospirillaceae bacterium]|jgi:GTP cyclohydrolase II|nr:GTP cyclohydrolase II [Rhodospirillaceae bacterium]MBT5455082.1 GTP cyclohydrolase II [Rhodospirillaceae bacterium]
MTGAKKESAATRDASLFAVDRAAYELRRGRPVCVTDDTGNAVVAVSAELATDDSIGRLSALAGVKPDLAITHHRARTLKVALYTEDIVLMPFPSWLTADMARSVADPTSDLANPLRGPFTAKRDPVTESGIAAVQLAKIARLLPAVLLVSIPKKNKLSKEDIARVGAAHVMDYELDSAGSLKQVTAAKVPLEDAEDARILAFRSSDGGREHLAIVIGEPASDRPVLVRLHSECFTGDLIGSLKCDCGQQLRGAIAEIAREGAGILLYLRQEGRGIGLINKLRAYALQGQGFDTVEANERLGFESDERVFLPAARILKQLGYSQVRLMTNNPDKVAGLEQYGIEVIDRVQHAFPSNDHNEFYLSTKKEKSGHLL